MIIFTHYQQSLQRNNKYVFLVSLSLFFDFCTLFFQDDLPLKRNSFRFAESELSCFTLFFAMPKYQQEIAKIAIRSQNCSTFSLKIKDVLFEKHTLAIQKPARQFETQFSKYSLVPNKSSRSASRRQQCQK